MEIKTRELVNEILSWWKSHQFDVSTSDNDGYAEEFNVYDETPDFVEMAQELDKGDKNGS